MGKQHKKDKKVVVLENWEPEGNYVTTNEQDIILTHCLN